MATQNESAASRMLQTQAKGRKFLMLQGGTALVRRGGCGTKQACGERAQGGMGGQGREGKGGLHGAHHAGVHTHVHVHTQDALNTCTFPLE